VGGGVTGPAAVVRREEGAGDPRKAAGSFMRCAEDAAEAAPAAATASSNTATEQASASAARRHSRRLAREGMKALKERAVRGVRERGEGREQFQPPPLSYLIHHTSSASSSP
jgi:SOS-response transcriptional repressor LexA